MHRLHEAPANRYFGKRHDRPRAPRSHPARTQRCLCIQIEIGSMEHKPDVCGLSIVLWKVQRVHRPGGFIEK